MKVSVRFFLICGKNLQQSFEFLEISATFKIWNEHLQEHIYVYDRVDIVAIRPHILIRSVKCDKGYDTIRCYGDLLEGPTNYPFNVVKHQQLANAGFNGKLLSVSD